MMLPWAQTGEQVNFNLATFRLQTLSQKMLKYDPALVSLGAWLQYFLRLKNSRCSIYIYILNTHTYKTSIFMAWTVT